MRLPTTVLTPLKTKRNTNKFKYNITLTDGNNNKIISDNKIVDPNTAIQIINTIDMSLTPDIINEKDVISFRV